MKITAALAALLLLTVASRAHAERARTPADATVFIRVTVSLHATLEVGSGMSRRVDEEMLRASGSGFVLSSLGYVLTNHHVVNPKLEEFFEGQSGVKATGTLSVVSIAVCVPREAAVWTELVAQPGPDESKCLDASIMADDESLDLAVLSVSAPNLPYLAFGDSDAVVMGQVQQALGFPLGTRLEIGKEGVGRDTVPSLTQSSGTISALRMGCGTSQRRGPCVTAADRERERRYFQVTNSLNPGNSGGPIVDARGFAIGVVVSGALGAGGRRAEGIGFAIPINVVKDFLEDRGLDSALTARRVWPGPVHAPELKRLRVQMPEGLSDVATVVTRVETDAQQVGLSLRIDRVLSPWSSLRLEEELLGTVTFERGSWQVHESRVLSGGGRTPIRVGRATGEPSTGGEAVWLLYGILDLGTEKLVARYLGSAEWLAFNERVLTDSVASLEAQRFPVPDAGFVDRLTWSAGVDAQGQPVLPIPVGWSITSAGPAPCAGLPVPASVGSASSNDDYVVTLRTAVWTESGMAPASAAAACSSARGSQPGSSYSTQFEWLGVRWIADGVFVRTAPNRLIRLEVLAPESRGAQARAELAAWVRRAVP